MTGPLSGKSALVTGGGAGIGEAIARRFAAEGAAVIVMDVNGEAAERVAADIGATAWRLDLADSNALTELSLTSDILVNNAGLQHVSPVDQFPPDMFHRILAVMLEAPFLLMRAVLPHMYAQGFGRIINVTSVHGLIASPFKSAYVAAKHGLEGLSKVVALEGGARGVTSVCISPGYVRTALVDQQISDQARAHHIRDDEVLQQVFLADTAVKRLVEPSEVAALASFLAGPDAGMANGSSFTLDGGWSAR